MEAGNTSLQMRNIGQSILDALFRSKVALFLILLIEQLFQVFVCISQMV